MLRDIVCKIVDVNAQDTFGNESRRATTICVRHTFISHVGRCVVITMIDIPEAYFWLVLNSRHLPKNEVSLTECSFLIPDLNPSPRKKIFTASINNNINSTSISTKSSATHSTHPSSQQHGETHQARANLHPSRPRLLLSRRRKPTRFYHQRQRNTLQTSLRGTNARGLRDGI